MLPPAFVLAPCLSPAQHGTAEAYILTCSQGDWLCLSSWGSPVPMLGQEVVVERQCLVRSLC